METVLTRNTQIMHSRLAEQITPYRDIVRSQWAAALSTTRGLTALNATITEQAAMIAYNNDFKFMMVLTMCSIPLVLLLRRGSSSQGTSSAVIE
jgi:MFS transporter, DHA2 family, multidrug resistance protein